MADCKGTRSSRGNPAVGLQKSCLLPQVLVRQILSLPGLGLPIMLIFFVLSRLVDSPPPPLETLSSRPAIP